MNAKDCRNKVEYLLRIAEVIASESEDPFYKVGAVAADENWRIKGTGYNGLPSGVTENFAFWNNKEKRRPFIIHAEANLCSQFKYGEATHVAITLMPCPSCFKLLVASGVKHIYYRIEHEKSLDSNLLALHYGVALEHVPEKP